MSNSALKLCQPGGNFSLRVASKPTASHRAAMRNDSIANAFSGLGTQDDVAVQARPTFGTRLSDYELDALYMTCDLARRGIDELVDDATRGGWTARDAETKEPIKDPLATRLHVAVRRACKDARLYGAGAVWLVPSGNVSMANELEDDEEIVNFINLDRQELSPRTYESDRTKEYYGDPRTYSVSPNTRGGGGGAYEPAVHRSRLLYFKGAELPRRLEYINDGFPDSILQAVWPTLQRFLSTEQAIANIVQRFETATISIAGLSDVLASDEGPELILERVQLMARTLSMINAAVVDKDAGETYERKFATVSGLDTIWDRKAHSVAKAFKTPMTQLFGMSPSGLSTDDESGRANWRKEVVSFQELDIKPELERYYRVLNNGRPVEVIFAPVDETTPGQEAEITLKRASAFGQYAQNTEGGAPEVLSSPQMVAHLKVEGLLHRDFEVLEAPELEPPLNQDASEADGLQAKAEGLEGIGVSTLQKVYDRGVGAYETNPGSVHEGVSSSDQWAMGRVNSFIRIFKGDKSSNLHDLDLLPSDHPRSSREDAKTFSLPEGARSNAQQVLDWREEHGDEVAGMTEVGWRRARQLANNEAVGLETVKAMAQFNRHRKNSTVASEFEDKPWKDAGYVAWLGWGGDSGVNWAIETSKGETDD